MRARHVVLALCGAGALAGIGLVAYRRTHLSHRHVTRTSCMTLRTGAISWRADHPGSPCPTPDQVQKDGFLDPDFRTADRWGNAFLLRCTDKDITCSSAGPDRRWGTADDVVVAVPEVR